MQPLAWFALAAGIAMILGVSAMLIISRPEAASRPAAIGRWHRHGSIPLAAAGLALGAISLGSGQTPATHAVLFAEAAALLLAALLCALAGATAATRQRHGRGPA